jgi:hypothetical protein
VSREVKKHSEEKEYIIYISRSNGNSSGILSHIRAAEEIPKEIINSSCSVESKGITGSDFLLEELYKHPSWGFTTYDGKPIDPRSVYPEEVDTYTEYVFGESRKLVPRDKTKELHYINGKILVVRFLYQDSKPKMCILGANDRTLDEIKELKKRMGKK